MTLNKSDLDINEKELSKTKINDEKYSNYVEKIIIKLITKNTKFDHSKYYNRINSIF